MIKSCMAVNRELIVCGLSGSSNLNVSRNSLVNMKKNNDNNKLNISGLSHYRDKTYIIIDYYDTAYINTTYSDKTSIDLLLSTLAKPHYGWFISSAGAINRNTGTYTHTVPKLGAGSCHIFYDVSLASANYAVLCNPRISTAACVTYSSQTTTSVYIYTWNGSGAATDIGVLLLFIQFWLRSY